MVIFSTIISGLTSAIMVTAAFGAVSLFSSIYISIYFEGVSIGAILALTLKALTTVILNRDDSNNIVE